MLSVWVLSIDTTAICREGNIGFIVIGNHSIGIISLRKIINEDGTNAVAEKHEDKKVEVNKEEKPSFAPKAVVQKDLETGEVIDLFNSVAEAERKTHISRKSISKAANGKAKSAGGFGWEFVTINP